MTLARIRTGSAAYTKRSADRQLSVRLDTSYAVAFGSGGLDGTIVSPTTEGFPMALTDGLRKPASCPSCKGSDIRRIMYGLPNTATLELAERGEVILGGCSIFEDMPDWRCTGCGNSWFDPTDPVRIEWDQLLIRLEREHYEKLNGNATE